MLEIIEASGLSDDDADGPGLLLQPFQVGNLMRLAIVASHVIEAECDTAMQWTEEHGRATLGAG